MNEEFLSLSCADNLLTAALHGELDHHSAARVREQIDEALYFHRPATLNIDISDVNFMDSSGLGLIMGRLAKTKELGTALTVSGASPRAARMFQMAGLQHLIKEERK